MSSSRRGGAEINILAMLDRQARKPGPFAWLPRAAWYGSGGMLACALAGAVAWLVHDQSGSGFEGRVPAGPPVVPLEIVSETVPNPALQVDPPRTHGATVVDVAAAAPDEGADAAADEGADAAADEGADAAADAGADVASAAQPAPPGARVMDDPQQETQALAAVTPASAPPQAPVPVHPDAPVVVAVSAAVTRPPHHASQRVPPKAAPVSRSVLAETRQPASPHARLTAPTARKAKPASAAVDTDVALISAIIQHVNQRGEAKDGTTKMPNRP
jgi:hypothetical protein